MRTALVSGASTGIGRSVAVRLANAGWRVFAGVRTEDAGLSLLEQVRDSAGELAPVLLDVTSTSSITKTIERVAAGGSGGLDVLVNNAGIASGGPVEHLPMDEWRAVFEVNFFGVIDLTRQALGVMKASPSSRIIMIGSINSRVAVPLLGPYVGSKHALAGVVGCMRRELAPQGPLVTLVEPGAVKTPIWDKAKGELARISALIPPEGHERYGRFIAAQQQALVDGHEQGLDPDDVAELVERIATVDRPRSRYLIGRDAQVAGWAQRALPDRAMEFLAAKMTDRATTGRHGGADQAS